MNTKSEIPLHEKFANHIKNCELTYISIATELDLSRSHLGRVLSGKRELSESLRAKLNAYFDTSY
jgi:plasmid maintenance system antidote protein VapI